MEMAADDGDPLLHWNGGDLTAIGHLRPQTPTLLKPSAVTEHPVKTHGRRYLPHQHGKETIYRPHIQHIEPVLTESGPDWKSRRRWLPEPRYSNAPFPHIKDIKFPLGTRLMRPFPQANMVSRSEWTFYPNFGQPTTCHVGKRCIFDGFKHCRSLRSSSETSLESLIVRKKQAKPTCDTSMGSKPYFSPEYSTDFHKYGSTLPITFGSSATLKADTLIPLYSPPLPSCVPYAEKKKIQERETEIFEVKKLNEWRPATPIFQTVVFNGDERSSLSA